MQSKLEQTLVRHCANCHFSVAFSFLAMKISCLVKNLQILWPWHSTTRTVANSMVQGHFWFHNDYTPPSWILVCVNGPSPHCSIRGPSILTGAPRGLHLYELLQEKLSPTRVDTSAAATTLYYV